MRPEAQELMRLLLNEAVGNDADAEELTTWAADERGTVIAPALRALARNKRIRALELRGQAAALAAGHS